MMTGIASMATRGWLAALVSAYQRSSPVRVAIESVGGVEAMRRVQSGEPFDVVVLAAEAIGRLEHAGHVVPGSRVDLARSGVAVAVRAGVPRPEIDTEAALRDAVRAARSIGYSTGPSGQHLFRVFERWGMADVIAPKLVQAPPGVAVGTLVARGEAELGFQQLSELMNVPGIDVIGPMPPDTQCMTVFSAAIVMASNQKENAAQLLAFLASPHADAAKREQGMEPV
jgi:molybdate transport system substrate-binding protein